MLESKFNAYDQNKIDSQPLNLTFDSVVIERKRVEGRERVRILDRIAKL